MKQILAEIITIGDEILFGQIVDTNSQWMSAELDKVGIKVIQKTCIADDREDILKTFAEAEERADIILITGGLGPTNDDLTKPCLAEYFNAELVMNEQALKEITELFESRGFELTEINRQQAALPKGCTMLSNKMGTAAGMWFDKNGKVFVSMPGVPFEMKFLMTESVIPRLKEAFRIPVIYHKLIKTTGIGESWLADHIKEWESALPQDIKLAYLPSPGMVKLRLTAQGSNQAVLEKRVQEQIDHLMPLAGKYIFGYNSDTLESAVGKLLIEQNKTLAIAESCSGGYLSHKITSIAGSSAYFSGGIVPYSNEIKINILGVKSQTIETHGAVSEETVSEMANQVRIKFGTSIGIATSGIAGPGGGTKEKPVGTIWVAFADGQTTKTRKLQLTRKRDTNIQYTAMAALNLLWRRLNEND